MLKPHMQGRCSGLVFSFTLLLLLSTSGCRFYRQDILFRADSADVAQATALQQALSQAERNYKIRVDDFVHLQVFTNDGEIILDPTGELQRQMMGGQGMIMQQGQGQGQGRNLTQMGYLVQYDGYAKLPMVGMVRLAGLTHQQADSLLELRFQEFYEDPFVKIRAIESRRVFVLGATMAGGQVIPLQFEGMSLIEVLALCGGLDMQANASNIRLIRGDLAEPQVQIIDLSTLQGLRQAELTMLPNDIVYVEPGRRPTLDVIRDFTPLLGLFTSLTTVVLLLTRL
ncbi:MAG: polysaccharide biosynthesis/export family protein [Catalinimonas sp.]